MLNRLLEPSVGKLAHMVLRRGKRESTYSSQQIQQYCIMGSNSISSVGDVVQLVERMFCKHEAVGSNPIVSK